MKTATLLLIFAAGLRAQTLSLVAPASIRPGGTGTVTVRYAPANGTQVAALQWTLAIPAPLAVSLGPTNPAAGAAATAAGKTRLDCANTTCISIGLNANVIGAGDIATYTVSVPAGTAPQNLSFGLSSPVAVSPAAAGVSIAAGGTASIVIPQAADLNGDGAVDDRDLQISLDQIQGRAPCASADLNGDGRCELADAQVLVNRRTVP